MRKASNVKSISPLRVPKKDSSFKLSGRSFTVKSVNQFQNNEGNYVAQCEIETTDCEILMVMTAPKPFKSE